MRKAGTPRKNLLLACGAIVSGAVVLTLAGNIYEGARGLSGPSPTSVAQTSLESVLGGVGFRDDSDRLPAGLREEIFPLDGFFDVRVSNGGGVIGLLTHEGAETVMARCCAGLSAKGWTQVASGQGTCASFVKAQGVFTWLLISCVEIDGDTSVLVVPA